MRMNLILEILDVPGQLVSILNPIGELGANVVTIVHKREIKAEEGKAAIQIAIEGERENLQAVIDRFKEMNIHCQKGKVKCNSLWPHYRQGLKGHCR